MFAVKRESELLKPATQRFGPQSGIFSQRPLLCQKSPFARLRPIWHRAGQRVDPGGGRSLVRRLGSYYTLLPPVVFGDPKVNQFHA